MQVITTRPLSDFLPSHRGGWKTAGEVLVAWKAGEYLGALKNKHCGQDIERFDLSQADGWVDDVYQQLLLEVAHGFLTMDFIEAMAKESDQQVGTPYIPSVTPFAMQREVEANAAMLRATSAICWQMEELYHHQQYGLVPA